MGEKELQPPSPVAHSVSGNRIQLLGQRQCTYSFHDASAQGSFYMANTPRPVPYPAQHAVGKQLDRNESNGVISKVNYSDWSSTQHQSFSSRSRTDHYAYRRLLHRP
ncbi:hypothetical protein Aduo_016489 [Ancylostoma duodenale]